MLRLGALASAVVLKAGVALALCQDGRHPDVAAGFRVSRYVVTAVVESSRTESSPDDPEGVADTVYTVRVVRVFKGKPGRVLTITDENTSSRFPMAIGKEYLLFVRTFPDGNFVDSCGKSGLLERSKEELAEVEKMAERR
jgi:hypothetical protein